MNLRGKIPLSFETERLLVRRYRISDEADLYRSARASISEVFAFLPWCHPDYSREEAREWLAKIEADWRDGSTYNFAIFSKNGETFHGGCGLDRVDEHPTANLGYWIKTSSAGRGIAAEASVGLARFGIERIGLQRLEIIMSTNNPGSKRIAEKVGATFEGTLRNRLQLHGNLHDAYVYSIVPEDL